MQSSFLPLRRHATSVGGSDQAQRRPGGDDEGHQQREDHGGRGAHRDGAHVGAHEAADEGHGQDGGDDRQGGQDGRVADFVHRLDGHREAGAVVVLGQAEVADDVLHHHDGVVDQDADGEDEGEEGDAVEGVAVEVEDEQGQGQGDRDGQGHHPRLPVAEGEPDEQRHRNDGDAACAAGVRWISPWPFRRSPG